MVDFYWPQLLHALLLESRRVCPVSVAHVALLQEGVLSICLRFPRLALKTGGNPIFTALNTYILLRYYILFFYLAWFTFSVITDYREGKATAPQFASATCLLLQLDLAMSGVSNILGSEGSSGKFPARVYCDILDGAPHQKHELLHEFSTLFRTRLQINQLESNLLHTRVLASEDSMLQCMWGRENVVESCGGLFAFVAHQLGLLKVDSLIVKYAMQAPPMPSIHAPATNALMMHQLDFIHQLTLLVDNLRLVDRPLRTERLRKDLKRLSLTTTFGFDPIGVAWAPRYRIVKVHYPECRVFRTKARAPSQITCEVMREDDVATVISSLLFRLLCY